MRYPIWIRNPFYHLFYVDYSIESSHDFRGEQGRRETGSNLFVIAIACVLLPAFYMQVENQLTSLVRVESILLIQLAVISLLRLVNRIERTPEILNIIITLLFLASGTATILVCNHENIWEQTEVRAEYLSMYFHIVKFPRASIFSCLLFKFLQFKMFDDHLWFGWKVLKNSSILTLLRLQ